MSPDQIEFLYGIAGIVSAGLFIYAIISACS